MARFVQKHGPFCPEDWSVLSWNVVRFVLRRGPFCLVRFVHGPFCPSTLITTPYYKVHAGPRSAIGRAPDS